jgi:hypothetical protein
MMSRPAAQSIIMIDPSEMPKPSQRAIQSFQSTEEQKDLQKVTQESND